MSYEAAFWRPSDERPPMEEALAEPRLGAYLEGWGRPGDAGVIGIDVGGRPVGAAWYRLFPADEPGYGFVDPETPELSIAVVPDRRGEGVGEMLLSALLERARADGFQAVSLSVAPANRARRLYERNGFVKVGQSGGSLTLLKLLA